MVENWLNMENKIWSMERQILLESYVSKFQIYDIASIFVSLYKSNLQT